MSTPPALTHKNNIDFMRLVFALMVIWGHAFVLVSGDEGTEPLARITHGQYYAGRIAVFSFFWISGFLISQSWERSPGFKDYITKRLKRICPGFVAASLISAFLFAPLGASNLHDYWKSFQVGHYVLSLLCLHTPVVPTILQTLPFHEINGSLWTIQPEFICYLIIAVLGIAGLSRKPFLLATLTGIILLLHWVHSIHPITALSVSPKGLCSFGHMLPSLAYFCVGMTCSAFRDRLTIKDTSALSALVAFIIASQLKDGLLFILPFTLPIMLLWLAYTPRIRMSSWSERYGDLSYGMYLYACPIQQLALLYIPAARHPFVLFCVGVFLTLLPAYLSWHCIEKRFLRGRQVRSSTPDSITPSLYPPLVSDQKL